MFRANKLDNWTTSHELFHALGLAHSFTNKEADANAFYTFKAQTTENIMDYSLWYSSKTLFPMEVAMGHIKVNAPNDMNFTVGKDLNMQVGNNINMSAGMNMHTTVGQNATTNVGMQYSLFAGDIFESADRSIQSQAEEIKENAKERSATSEGKTNFHTQESFKNNSGEKSNLF